MVTYAKITRELADTGQRADLDPSLVAAPSDLAPNKPYWVPVVEVQDDTSTGPDVVVTITEQVFADRFERTVHTRDKTEQEIETELDAEIDMADNDRGLARAYIRVLFDQENRLRVLEGAPALTFGEFRSSLRLYMRP